MAPAPPPSLMLRVRVCFGSEHLACPLPSPTLAFSPGPDAAGCTVAPQGVSVWKTVGGPAIHLGRWKRSQDLRADLAAARGA